MLYMYSRVYTNIENHRKSAECLCKIATAKITAHSTPELCSVTVPEVNFLLDLLSSNNSVPVCCVLERCIYGCALVKLPVTSFILSHDSSGESGLHETLVLILSLSKWGSLLYAL